MTYLKADTREYLIKLAASPEVIASIEERMDRARKRYLLLSIAAMIMVVAITIAALFWINLELYNSFDSFLLGYLALYTIALLIVYPVARSSPGFRTFNMLATCISNADATIGTPPAAKPRRVLANKLLTCLQRMRAYRPLVPLKIHDRIISQEAIRANRALRQLVRPIILGTDEELEQVKETLALAAIKIGTGNWVQVGDLADPDTSKPVRSQALFRSSIPIIAGIVVPLVAALISALVK